MKHLNFVKGILVGIAKIIPGFSGAILMVSFQLYDRAIAAITHFFDDVYKNFFFLLELGFGILIGIVLFSRVIGFFLHYYYLYTSVLFLGLMIGGFPMLWKSFSKSKAHMGVVIFSFLFLIVISITHLDYCYVIRHNFFDYIIFFLAGVLEAIGTVLPGVSSTALLMLVGVYSYYIFIISNLFHFSMLGVVLSFMIPFSLGMFLGIVCLSLLVGWLFRFFKEGTFACIFGFSFASFVLVFLKLIPLVHSIFSFFLCLFFLVIGYFVTSKL